MANPYYEYFNAIVQNKHGGGEEYTEEQQEQERDDPNDIRRVYRGVLFQRGYGVIGGYGVMCDVYNMQGLGFRDVMNNLFRIVFPYVKSGMQYLGKQAVSTAANIAQDAIKGENVKEAAKKHIKTTAEEVFAKAPTQIVTEINRKRKGDQRNIVSQIPTSARNRSRPPRKQQKLSYKKYPGLAKIK